MSIYNCIHTEIYSLKSYDVNFLITWIFELQALSSTNYFSMSILRGSVTSLAWKQAPPCGEEEKNFGESRGSLRREKGGAALFPSPGHPSARFFRRYFSYLTPIFAFSPTAEPGPGLMTVTLALWYLRKYLWKTKSHLHVSNTSSLITNNKNEHWEIVSRA